MNIVMAPLHVAALHSGMSTDHIILHVLMATVATILTIGLIILYKLVQKLYKIIERTPKNITEAVVEMTKEVNVKEGTNALYLPITGVAEVDEYELSVEYAQKLLEYQCVLIKGEPIRVYDHLYIEYQRNRGYYRWDDRETAGKIPISAPRITAYLRVKILKDKYNGDFKG